MVLAPFPAPAIIIPDTAPLIHLAAGQLLHLLPRLGRVVIPDVVALEATRLPDKPWAQEVATWLATATVEIADTEIGELYGLAIEQGRRPPRNAGEIGILLWLQKQVAETDLEALVIVEDRRARRMLDLESFGDRVAAVTTRGLLDLAQDRGLIASADEAFQAILTVAPTAGSS